jgi:hypothetical protein
MRTALVSDRRPVTASGSLTMLIVVPSAVRVA